MSAFSSAIHIELMSEQAGNRTAWVHIIPSGRFDGLDGRGPYVLADAGRVIADTQTHFGKRQIPIDYEHQTQNSQKNGQPAPAAGWIVGLEGRDDGIWGKVEWTEAAARHIARREYRYLSPVFFHNKDDGTILRLETAALTNRPNLDQIVALYRAETPMDQTIIAGKLRELAGLLGLPEDALQTETFLSRLSEIMTRLKEIGRLAGLGDIGTEPAAQSAAMPDPSKFVPIGEFERVVADANRLRQGVTQKAAEAHVAEHIRTGKLAPFMKEWAISLCTVNMPQFDAFIERTGPAFNQIVDPQRIATAHPPRGDRTSSLNSSEMAVCRNLGLTPDEFIQARGNAGTQTE